MIGMQKCLKENNLLVISHSYNSFQKDQIEHISSSFSSLNVLVRFNPFADLSKIFPLQNLDVYSSNYKIDRTSSPKNTCVHTTKVWYLPTDWEYKKLGDRHLSVVKDQLRKHKIHFDLIHAHFTWSAGYVGARIKEEYNVPFVVTAHGYDIYRLPFQDTIWREKIEYVLNTADTIITVSKSNQECIKQLNVNVPVKVIPNGFKNDLFYPRDSLICRQRLNLPQNRKILLTVGNLELADKGQNFLIEAVKIISLIRKDILCVIVGMGKDKEAIHKHLNSLKLGKNIMLVGGKPHDEIPLWINACDLFVLPSLNEGNPTVMFEALGCGKPFVGTRVGGVPEVITSDEYGLLVDPGDAEHLAEKILMALDWEWDRERILTYARRYTWENISKEIMGVYKQVMK